MKLRPDAQEIFAGAMYLIFAGLMLWLNLDHSVGSARRMGPGYLPMVTFGILAVIGATMLIGGLFTGSNPIAAFAWRDLGLVLFAIVVFGLTVERLGFVVSITLCVGLSSLAEKVWVPLRVAGLIAFLLALCWFLFIWYLDIRIPVFPWSY